MKTSKIVICSAVALCMALAMLGMTGCNRCEVKHVIPESVLFIGNSYTERNNMTSMFKSLVESTGRTIHVDTVVRGGYRLSQFADSANEYGKQVDQLLANNKYDYVVIQEQSTLPITARDEFFAGVRALNTKIKASGAETVLFQTWGRKTGNSFLIEHSLTTAQMESQLRSAYKTIANELKLKVSYVGVAFTEVYQTFQNLELYEPDGTHPSPIGSYLVACVHYATLFNTSPLGIAYIGAFTLTQARDMQQAAGKTLEL
jgi:hypothetical protein